MNLPLVRNFALITGSDYMDGKAAKEDREQGYIVDDLVNQVLCHDVSATTNQLSKTKRESAIDTFGTILAPSSKLPYNSTQPKHPIGYFCHIPIT